MAVSAGGGGETAEHRSAWTVDTLAVHLQRQIDDLTDRLEERHNAAQLAMSTALTAADRATAAALASAKEAVSKAEAASDKRFDAANAFRSQLADQATTFLPRAEAEVRLGALERAHDELTARLNVSSGRSGGYQSLYGWIVAALGLLVSVVVAVNVLTS